MAGFTLSLVSEVRILGVFIYKVNFNIILAIYL